MDNEDTTIPGDYNDHVTIRWNEADSTVLLIISPIVNDGDDSIGFNNYESFGKFIDECQKIKRRMLTASIDKHRVKEN